MKRQLTALVLSAILIPTAASALPAPGTSLKTPTMPTAAGSSVSVAALQGKPVYLNFFATWCGPCNEEAPALEAVAKANKGLDVIGVDEEESASSAQSFAAKYGLTYPIALDQSGAVGDQMGLYATPTNVFIDSTGHVSSVVVGEMTPAEINAAIKPLL
ncbi:MAG: TlpA disulfide reductase family protein [Candidatus Lustribacter sp.]|jgi:thiol-disulfide isomerase/thioredoxin